MSCHSSHVGIATTGAAKAITGLDDAQVQSIYHQAKRDGKDAPAPSAQEAAAWFTRMRAAVLDNTELDERTRQRLADRYAKAAVDAEAGNVPDGPTFYAAQLALPMAESSAQVLAIALRSAARQQRVAPERLAARFARWRDRTDYEDVEAPDPAFRYTSEELPQDKRTQRALRKLSWENYLAQRLPVFVYGTLRTGQHNSGLINEEAVGAKVNGRIDGVAIYGPERGFPYAQESPDGQGYTVGEMVELHDSWQGDEVRESLDYLEGFDSDGPSHSHYRRVIRDVTYTDPGTGQARTGRAWVYLAGNGHRDTLTEDERIHDGDWVAAKNAAADRRFAARQAARAAESDDVEYTGTYRTVRRSWDTSGDQPARSARDAAAAFGLLDD